MRRYLLAFTLGFLSSTFLFLALLSVIEIPEYAVIYKMDNSQCESSNWIKTAY